MLKKFNFTHWQLHKCVTWVTIYKKPSHKESRKCGIFRESFPRCLKKTSIRHSHHYSIEKTKEETRDVDIHTNLSINLGFMSRLYIVKSRKGASFNKISPTRPEKTQKQNWVVQYWLSTPLNKEQIQHCTADSLSITFTLFVEAHTLVNTSTIFHQQA